MGQMISNLIEISVEPLKNSQCPIYDNSGRYNHSGIDYSSRLDKKIVDEKLSLANIAEQFESLQERAMKFGLNSLVDPIKDTVESLKDLHNSHTSIPTSQQLSKTEPCNCRVWGPDSLTPEGEWICSCGNQCQCDKISNWPIIQDSHDHINRKSFENNRTSLNKINLKSNEEEMKSICKGEREPNIQPCKCYCHSLQVKGKGGCIAGDLVTSSEDDPSITGSHEEIVDTERLAMIKCLSDDTETRHSNEEVEDEETNEQNQLADPVRFKLKSKASPDKTEKIEENDGEAEHERQVMKTNVGSSKKERSNIGLTCPCGCGFTPKGEIRICPCGCGQMVEIVDDLEKIHSGVKLTGPCCSCIRHIPEECLKNVSKLSLDTLKDTGLMTALELLQMKCRVKDGLIAVLAKKLRNTVNVDEIAESLSSPNLSKTDIDFDRSLLYEFLKQSTFSEPPSDEQLNQHDSVPPPKNFRVVKPILQSLMLAWELPDDLSNIRGYEIQANGVIKKRIRSAMRSQMILTSLDLTKPTELTLYSVATNGHTSEPLRINYSGQKQSR